MAKFAGKTTAPPRVTSPIRSNGIAAPTFEGGDGVERDAKSELFLLAATNMVGEDTFYESATVRDERFTKLIAAVVASDPEWVKGFAGYLRSALNMRSASTVLAAEYVAAGGPNGRAVVSSALQRADEPAELIGYWHSTHGRKMPAALKRGLADAVVNLYNERAALRYDGTGNAIRMGDVIELVHPIPKAPWQSALFRYLIDKRHNREDPRLDGGTHGEEGIALPVIVMDRDLLALPAAERRAALHDGRVAKAGWSWERLAGWLPGGMDADAWSGVIPQMGFMALARNLRNFENKGVPEEVKDAIIARLSDPAEVAKSRQFPFRFWSAYKANASLTWGRALERALDLSVSNIPALPGRTLVLIDTSGSMNSPVSGRSEVKRYEVGAIFAAALAKRCAAGSADVVLFATLDMSFPLQQGESVLRYVERVGRNLGVVGHGTETWRAVQSAYAGHDRIVIFTDEQTADRYVPGASGDMPAIHIFNLAGYGVGMAGGEKVHVYGGFSDATFTLMGLLERGRDAPWPWSQ